MFLRLCLTILIVSAVGCESLSLTQRTSDSVKPSEPKLALTTYKQTTTTETPAITERMVIPEEVTKGNTSQESDQAEPFPTVYFPFNSWEITPELQKRLDSTAKWMTHFSTYGLTIEGHTDVRGSESYNMILGIKRAKAVKDYLANLGIPRMRLDIVSYGNTLVLCDVDDENRCHKFNRRADLLLE